MGPCLFGRQGVCIWTSGCIHLDEQQQQQQTELLFSTSRHCSMLISQTTNDSVPPDDTSSMKDASCRPNRVPLPKIGCCATIKALLGIWLGRRATCQIAPACPFLPASLVANPIHCSVTGWLGWLFVIHSFHLSHFQNFRWRIFSYNI